MAVQRPRKWNSAQWRNWIFILILIVCVTVFYGMKGSETVNFAFEEDGVTLTGPKDAPFSVTIDYDDISSVSEITELDAGDKLTGVDTDRCRFGTWKNETWGEYTLCIIPKCADYIVFETADGVVVCNYENEDSTQHLYTAILELLETKQPAE